MWCIVSDFVCEGVLDIRFCGCFTVFANSIITFPSFWMLYWVICFTVYRIDFPRHFLIIGWLGILGMLVGFVGKLRHFPLTIGVLKYLPGFIYTFYGFDKLPIYLWIFWVTGSSIHL